MVAGTGGGPDAVRAEPLIGLANGHWQAPSEGVSLEPYETVAAVMFCLIGSDTLRQALVNAVQLHGDTDTVAALVGGLLGSQLTPNDIRAQLPWSKAVLLPESDDQVVEVSEALGTARAVLSSAQANR